MLQQEWGNRPVLGPFFQICSHLGPQVPKMTPRDPKTEPPSLPREPKREKSAQNGPQKEPKLLQVASKSSNSCIKTIKHMFKKGPKSVLIFWYFGVCQRRQSTEPRISHRSKNTWVQRTARSDWINNPTQLAGGGFPYKFYINLIMSQFYVFLVLPNGWYGSQDFVGFLWIHRMSVNSRKSVNS